MKKLLITLLLGFISIAHANEDMPQHQLSNLVVSIAFDADGNLWRVRAKNDFVLVDMSRDLGKSFNKSIEINQVGQRIAVNGEERPKIAISPDGNIYLTWTEELKMPSSSYVWFARSTNGGKSFEQPYIVHRDHSEFNHRLDSLNVAENGKITVIWVDARDLVSAKATDKSYDVAAIYYAVSGNNGGSFSVEKKLLDSNCKCGHIVTTNKPDGTVVAMWEQLFSDHERDHMLGEIPQIDSSDQSTSFAVLKRATFDHLKEGACSEHGPAIAIGGQGKDWWGYHMAYFNGNDKAPGLYYSRMDGVAWASSPPKRFGNYKNQAAHPAVLSMGDQVWLVWREVEFKDNLPHNSVFSIYSEDGGRSWQDSKLMASSEGEADYPQLIASKGKAYLFWSTVDEGFLLLEL